MNELEERMRKVIKEKNFNFFEMAGFHTDPELALLAGMAMGYTLACDDIKAGITKIKEE